MVFESVSMIYTTLPIQVRCVTQQGLTWNEIGFWALQVVSAVPSTHSFWSLDNLCRNASVLSLSAAQYEPEVESLVPNAWRRWVQKKMAGLSQLAIVSTQLD